MYKMSDQVDKHLKDLQWFIERYSGFMSVANEKSPFNLHIKQAEILEGNFTGQTRVLNAVLKANNYQAGPMFNTKVFPPMTPNFFFEIQGNDRLRSRWPMESAPRWSRCLYRFI